MHPLRRQRLFVVIFIIAFSSLATVLVIYAMRENGNLFYPPSDVVSGIAPKDTQIRVGGYVVENSVMRSDQDLTVNFQLTDGTSRVTVSYTGILPDLFSEGEAAIAKGKLSNQGVLLATEVLAKHDENYTPPEVMDTAVRETSVNKEVSEMSSGAPE